jgi:hypothetical protein
VRQLRTCNMRAVDVGFNKLSLSLVALPMRTINIHSREERAHWPQSTRKLANPVNMKVVHACSHLEKAQQECMLTHAHAPQFVVGLGDRSGWSGCVSGYVGVRSPREVA